MIAQFAGTSLWFAGNAVIHELPSVSNIATITIAIQLGFIIGTLLFAMLSLADRFSPVRLFFVSCLLGSFFNLLVIWFAESSTAVLMLRFLTGFFLAGIYPVGMKIASDWHKEGLGKALGWLVGALVFGTAMPHLLKSTSFKLPWENVFFVTSLLAVIGGVAVLLWVNDGPFRRAGTSFKFQRAFDHFSSRQFRAAAFGYFGHMWELYTFWAFVPILVAVSVRNISFMSFLVIAMGGLGCIIGGYVALKKGSAKVAYWSLCVSFLCCLLAYPITRYIPELSIPFFLIWGFTVVSDSPQFSTLVARNAIPEQSGSALTLVTSLGFAITIVSIQLFEILFGSHIPEFLVFVILALGPLLGLLSIRKLSNGLKI